MAWLFITALAASPALHEYFHPDAGNTAHSCAVTLFAHGQLMGAGTLPVLAVFIALLLFSLPPVRLADFSSTDNRLGFGRAPPHFSGLR